MIHFPFSREELDFEVKRGLEIQQGSNLISSGRICETTGEIKIEVGSESRTGVFISQDDPRFSQLMK